jgi:hypothetical protein
MPCCAVLCRAVLCRLAALGTSLELKAEFGVGYTLTISLTTPGAGDGGTEAAASAATGAGGGVEALTALVRQHVGDAQLLAASGGWHVVCVRVRASSSHLIPLGPAQALAFSWLPCCPLSLLASWIFLLWHLLVLVHPPHCHWCCTAGSEAVYRLPKESAATFPPLLRALEQQRGGGSGGGGNGLGLAGYGLSETTLEEVFLRVSESAAADVAAAAARAAAAAAALAAAADGGDGGGGGAKEGGLEAGGEGQEREQDESEVTSLPRQYYLKVRRLYRIACSTTSAWPMRCAIKRQCQRRTA